MEPDDLRLPTVSLEDAPTGTGEPAPPSASPAPAHPHTPWDELARQIVELERTMPPPDPQAVRTDCLWIQNRWTTELLPRYRGTHVAVMGQQVIGTDSDSLRLQLDLARRLGVHPERIVIVYIPRIGEPF